MKVNTASFMPIPRSRFAVGSFLAVALFVQCLLGIAPALGEGELRLRQGGIVDLSPGSIVEGSASHGGLQPDYLLDLEHPALQPLLERAREIGASKLSYWEKIDSVQHFIRSEVLPNRNYDYGPYRALMARYRRLGKSVPIGEYARIQAGVCRESALLTHFALKAAGISNMLGYFQIRQETHVQDHVLCLVRSEKDIWVVDTYNANFNGYRLKDLLQGRTIQASRLAEAAPGNRRQILGLLEYPLFSIPVGTTQRPHCREVYALLDSLSSR